MRFKKTLGLGVRMWRMMEITTASYKLLLLPSELINILAVMLRSQEYYILLDGLYIVFD
jgi:hypothetical protein